jgi:NTP pyrophosphatase (non-canonical NTP hydrolase)
MNYLQDTKRTSPTTEQNIATVKRLEAFPIDENVDLLHSALGLVTESAEFADALKKTLFYGKALDKTNLREELGDILFYAALALRALETDFETVMATNLNKLKARYPEKFNYEDAENRDLAREREILEA